MILKIDDKLDIGSVCKATGVWLEEGQDYRIAVIAPGPKSDTPWKDGDMVVSTRGINTNNLSLTERLWQIFKWPLKRHLFVEPFKVIARVGSTRSDERILEPEDNRKNNNLNITFAPKRSGELFLYVNDAVWWPKRFRDSFYRDNVGTATIEVRRAN